MKTDNLSKIVVRMQRVVILKNVYHFFQGLLISYSIAKLYFFLITKHLTLFKEMDDLSMHELKCI